MRPLFLALLPALLLGSGAIAETPESAYLAARDRHIAALTKLEDARDPAPGDARLQTALADLEARMKTIVGPVAIVGFPTTARINLESLFPHDQEFGMLDGLVYGNGESDRILLVSTPGLLAAWLAAHRASGARDPSLPSDPAAAARTEIFYTWATNVGSAVVHYAAIPVAAPPGARFAHATLSARTQDRSPPVPDEIFVALETADRVFVVEEKLTTPVPPVAACDAVTKAFERRALAAEAAYTARKDAALADRPEQLRDEGDAAFRACVGRTSEGSPAFKAAAAQAAGVIAALSARPR